MSAVWLTGGGCLGNLDFYSEMCSPKSTFLFCFIFEDENDSLVFAIDVWKSLHWSCKIIGIIGLGLTISSVHVMAVYMFMTSSVLMHSHGLAEAVIFSRNYLDLVITKHGKFTIPEITPGVVRWIPDCIARKNGIDLIIFWDSVPYGSLRWCQGTMTWSNVVLWLVNTQWVWSLIGQVWCRAWRCGCGSPSQTGARNRKTYKTSGKDRIIMAFKRNFDKDQNTLSKRIRNDVLKDERRILCDVLDQWEVRWSWTGDAEDQWDAGMRSRDWAQPITGGGCCEGCWGGPGPVMPANQRTAATSDAGPWHWHVWGLGGACEAEMTGPMISEKMLWQTLSFTYFQAVSSCFVS